MTTLESAWLLAELESTVTENLDRHLSTAKEWMPHEFVPWSQGRDFAELGGEPWALEQSTLSPIARTALDTPVASADEVEILAAIAGGKGDDAQRQSPRSEPTTSFHSCDSLDCSTPFKS